MTELAKVRATHKETAKDFLRLAASGRAREAFGKYVGAGFRHHNAFFRGDADSLMVAMEENASKEPEQKLEIQRTIEEGNLVAVHSRITSPVHWANWCAI
jgi:predicted SnoaL-like aldol condensation-catalyzing enzyme